jgi:hypothetical protein
LPRDALQRAVKSLAQETVVLASVTQDPPSAPELAWGNPRTCRRTAQEHYGENRQAGRAVPWQALVSGAFWNSPKRVAWPSFLAAQ